jgi:hypothetical protein
MATQQDVMDKLLTRGTASATVATKAERRASRRCKITQLMRLRPSDPEKPQFDDIRGSLSVSRNGIFFQTSETGYEVGMRLFITMPYAQSVSSMSRDYLAEVVRKVDLPNGLTGIGFKILMELANHGGFSYGGDPKQE